MEIVPGAFHLPGYLSLEAQRSLVARCRQIGSGRAGFYRPRVKGGGQMRIEMLCLGLHWNAETYTYTSTRADYDDLPVPEIPDDLAALARRIAGEVGFSLDPQICILNHYRHGGTLGLHQDKDEQPDTLAAGVPIVSVSVGDTARFLIGGLRRRQPVNALALASGDALVMGGAARLRYHGVSAVQAGSAPPALKLAGRYNLTFRQYAFDPDDRPSR